MAASDPYRNDDGCLANMTGYDLGDFLREWLQAEGHDALSVCEVILMDARFEDLRQYVGAANMFWSHVQVEGFVGGMSRQHGKLTDKGLMTTMFLMSRLDGAIADAARRKLPPWESRFPWVDYFCLKQCRADFDVHAVVELIGIIGLVVAAVDNHLDYFGRSFCALELFGAVKGKAELFIFNTITSKKSSMMEILAPQCPADAFLAKYWIGPINAAAAITRDDKDKKQIDEFIRALPGGFDAFNASVTKAILDSCQE